MEVFREMELSMNNEIEKTLKLEMVNKLYKAYKDGELGGEKMPEDSNPCLKQDDLNNYLYFTLPMALNYQRNSYKLWEATLLTYCDEDINWLFKPQIVMQMSREEIQSGLTKYGVALQKNKQTDIWISLCKTFVEEFSGDIRKLFINNNYCVKEIKHYIESNKKLYPYLSGKKILNYWLYVMEQYTDLKYIDRENITIAPDTHIIQSTVKLGLINKDIINDTNIRDVVSNIWFDLLKDSKLVPIDIHTPLWLWSRSGFTYLIEGEYE